MVKEFGEVASDAIGLINELSDMTDIPKEEKLEKVTDKVCEIFESGDDVFVSTIPPGLRTWAKAFLDNPSVDDRQRDFARGVAEILYQGWKFTRTHLTNGE